MFRDRKIMLRDNDNDRRTRPLRVPGRRWQERVFGERVAPSILCKFREHNARFIHFVFSTRHGTDICVYTHRHTCICTYIIIIHNILFFQKTQSSRYAVVYGKLTVKCGRGRQKRINWYCIKYAHFVESRWCAFINLNHLGYWVLVFLLIHVNKKEKYYNK